MYILVNFGTVQIYRPTLQLYTNINSLTNMQITYMHKHLHSQCEVAPAQISWMVQQQEWHLILQVATLAGTNPFLLYQVTSPRSRADFGSLSYSSFPSF